MSERLTRLAKSLPQQAENAVTTLGQDLAIARKRRRITQSLMAERMMVNVETVQRLERGYPGVGIGVVASYLWVLGMQNRLKDLVSPAADSAGIAEENRRLPHRVRSPKLVDDMDF